MPGYRCSACGNKTRFDVFESRRTRRFHHYTLGGDLSVEEEETLDYQLEKVVCRWCGSSSVEQEADSGGQAAGPDVADAIEARG